MLFICQWLLFVKVMPSPHDMKWNVNFVWATHRYAQKRGWPRCRIYIYNYSHDTIISHHNSSARDVSSDREQALHTAYQTAAWQAWHRASGPVIYTMQSPTTAATPLLSVLLSFCVPLILNVCLSQCLCPSNSCCLSVPVSQNTKHTHLTGVTSSLSVV